MLLCQLIAGCSHTAWVVSPLQDKDEVGTLCAHHVLHASGPVQFADVGIQVVFRAFEVRPSKGSKCVGLVAIIRTRLRLNPPQVSRTQPSVQRVVACLCCASFETLTGRRVLHPLHDEGFTGTSDGSFFPRNGLQRITQHRRVLKTQ